jgi:predicted nucleic acid-binding protein
VARPARITVVADTGALYALIDKDDAWHARIVRWWQETNPAVLVPVTVLPEITYLLATRIGPAAEEAFVASVADGEFPVEPLEPDDVRRTAEVMRQYADLRVGFVDASIIAIAERLGTRDLLTTDRKHFGVVRPRHARAFTLLP